MKNRIIAFLSALFLCFTCCSCSQTNKQSDKIKVVSTVFAGYDFARAVFGDLAEIEMLVKPGVEIHSFDPSPADIIKIKNSDIFICVGGESEEWIENLDEDILDETKSFVMMDCVSLLNEEDVVSLEQGGEYDEHIWTSPKNAEKTVSKLADFAATKFPDLSNTLKQNSEKYRSDILKLDTAFNDFFKLNPNITLCFGDRFPLLYFVRQYNLKYIAAFSGCSAEVEPNPQMLARMIDEINNENIPVVFYIELSNHKVADTISEQTAVPTELFYSCQNISEKDFDTGQTYISMMSQNLNILKSFYSPEEQ